MERPHKAAGTRGAKPTKGRSLILLAMALLAFAAGAALAFGFTTKSKPLDASITAEQVGPTARAPVISTVELTDCDPMDTEEAAARAPSR